jgi:hypothetical protein
MDENNPHTMFESPRQLLKEDILRLKRNLTPVQFRGQPVPTVDPELTTHLQTLESYLSKINNSTITDAEIARAQENLRKLERQYYSSGKIMGNDLNDPVLPRPPTPDL